MWQVLRNHMLLWREGLGKYQLLLPPLRLLSNACMTWQVAFIHFLYSSRVKAFCKSRGYFSFHSLIIIHPFFLWFFSFKAIALIRLNCFQYLFVFVCTSRSIVLSAPFFVSMAGNLPKALILGHSFNKWLSRDTGKGFHDRADLSFGLAGSVLVHFHGVGGRTVEKLRAFDLSIIDSLAADIVKLEIGTNDLTCIPP